MQHAISETPMSTNQDPEAAVLPAPETEVVTRWKVACSGNEALGLGHPLVCCVSHPRPGSLTAAIATSVSSSTPNTRTRITDRRSLTGDH